jgi:hypothetical protein
MSEEKLKRAPSIREAARAVENAIKQHARVIGRGDASGAEVFRADKALGDALAAYRDAVMLRSGWTVPYSPVMPESEPVASEGADERDALGQLVQVEARYLLRILDPMRAFKLSEERARTTGGGGGCDDDSPYDVEATVHSLYMSDGWHPRTYDSKAIEVVGPWTLEVQEVDSD